MKKKIILVLAVLLLVVNAFSQGNTQNEYEEWIPSQEEFTSFDISKYITPDIVRNQLDINLNLHSNYSCSSGDSKYSTSEFSNSTFTGNIASYFSHYVNTRKKISGFAIGLSFDGDYNSQKRKWTFTDDNSTTVNINNNVRNISTSSLHLDWSNRRYFSKSIFMDYNIYSNVSYNFTQNKIEKQSEDSNQKQKTFFFHFSPQVGVGYGRIENVEDARQAIYIVNALSKRKVLTRNLSNNEMLELSQKISTVKNKRFLDSRLHLIDEITSVDSFFVNNNLLADNGAAYFTTLYDMWQYGALFSRKSGYEISFMARPYSVYQNEKNTPIMRNHIYNSNQYIISLDFSYEKPFKLNWQHSVAAGGYGGIYSNSYRNEQTDNNYTNNTDKVKAFSAFANYSLGYYPNTRTNIRVIAGQQMAKSIYDYDNERHQNTTSYHSTLRANLNYYFSPNFRVAGNCGLWYTPSRNRYKGYEGYYSNSNYFSSLFNIQLIYSIF
ncbi:MAG: hypothetical protein LBI82_03990 [Dysgonamonadaceae bacterium]|jgi:hypothetical protein|nr:hypothetical protein [Dysgonamonadaceae bacterium]